jgi:hypothetical protein
MNRLPSRWDSTIRTQRTRKEGSDLRSRSFALFASSWFLSVFSVGALTAQEPVSEISVRENMVGPYGPWLSEKVLGGGPARLSFRTGKWKTLDEWRAAGRARLLDCMAPVDLGGVPEVRVD